MITMSAPAASAVAVRGSSGSRRGHDSARASTTLRARPACAPSPTVSSWHPRRRPRSPDRRPHRAITSSCVRWTGVRARQLNARHHHHHLLVSIHEPDKLPRGSETRISTRRAAGAAICIGARMASELPPAHRGLAPSSPPTPQTSSGGRFRLRDLLPFGPRRHPARPFLEMLGVVWENRDNLPYAWRILTHGVCDGCSLGPARPARRRDRRRPPLHDAPEAAPAQHHGPDPRGAARTTSGAARARATSSCTGSADSRTR